MTGTWGVAAGIIGSILGAAALLGSGLFAARATRAAARTTAEATRAQAQAAAEPAQRAADLASFREIRDEMKLKIERQNARIDGLGSLVLAYSWTVDRLIHRMRDGGVTPDPGDIHDQVREHMRTGA
ncbi:hypothetical protein DCW30_05955 [Streptomyces alfalfae]|uniref:Secreted protein n=1 Tax=Streptomyces alfalfae TaxID=1642299 RepID=A0ABN4VLW1_9ACTN|nr:hypothetical protein [Streptomyces alfalfae]APY88159.1 hypothetical protein A7J05_22920 [Streptomyces alfalfae]AYA18552.1 hypothetical protein D3X13_22030 [Streptomyces fradiae]RXX46567.1 hypothetical protein DCW30_05955 [Streptomyces alfalfae]RZM90080.1 hypothetical protein D4104_25890 [Streptomyces alfalfae]